MITSVKYEGANLNAMTTIKKIVVNCELLGMEETFQGLVLAMHFPKHYNMVHQKNCFH
jgi:hypothetical protein